MVSHGVFIRFGIAALFRKSYYVKLFGDGVSYLGLASKERDGETDESGDSGRNENSLHVVKRRDHSSHVRERQSLEGTMHSTDSDVREAAQLFKDLRKLRGR